MEVLSCLLNRAIERNYFVGSRIAIGRGEDLVISHLLYADDTLIFCQANMEQLKYLSWILMWFEVLSGLKINLNKSEIIPIGTVDNTEELASLNWVVKLDHFLRPTWHFPLAPNIRLLECGT